MMADRKGPDPESDALLAEAFDWVVRLTSGDATVADAEALARWRAQSQAHERSFAEALRLRNALQVAGREVADPPAAPPTAGAATPVIGRRALLGGALAASAAGLLLARPPLDLWPSFTELSADYRTGTGERREVVLADGTLLDLNTRTSIVLRSSADGPRIELIAGEAAVATAGAPVVVVAGPGGAAAARARFNIRHVGARVGVTCLEGAVDVHWRELSVALGPDRQVVYTADGLGSPRPVDPATVTAWQDGLLVFNDEPLAAVIDEVNRYRAGKIILTKAALGSLPVNGVFHLDRLDGVIAQLRALGAEVTTLPGGFVLLG